MVHDAVPDNERVFAVINADSNNPCVEGVEFFRMLRELAQLACAVRSPVPPIENQEHTFAAHRRKTDGFTMLVLERKIWRRLTLGGSDLRPRQDL